MRAISLKGENNNKSRNQQMGSFSSKINNSYKNLSYEEKNVHSITRPKQQRQEIKQILMKLEK